VNLPTITIAIPTFNGAQLFSRALRSAISQTYSKLDIIISDDNSTDDTLAAVSSFQDARLRIVENQRHEGISANYNRCLNIAQGEYFLLLPQDDFLEADCINTLIEPYLTSSSISIVYAQWWCHTVEGSELRTSEAPEIEDGLEFVFGFWLGKRRPFLNAVLFKTDILRSIGGFEQSYAQDTIATIRCAFRGKVAHLRKPVAHYVLHPASATQSLDSSTRLHHLSRALDRTVEEGLAWGVPWQTLRSLQRRARRRNALRAALELTLSSRQGNSSRRLLAEYHHLRPYLNHNRTMGFLVLAAALFLPGCVMSQIMSLGKRLA
jgi:glycosyltransferase involved in cell wall biosynthesis